MLSDRIAQTPPDVFQVSMHLLVLSAFRRSIGATSETGPTVSMHLLVLSAFRHSRHSPLEFFFSLNAPFGAQCFPTRARPPYGTRAGGLNAPFGAQCFPTGYSTPSTAIGKSLNAPFGAQCFPTGFCSGLHHRPFGSQCTFWCSVLSDLVRIDPECS